MDDFRFPFGIQFCSVQSFSPVWLFVTPWTAACQASLSITNSQSLYHMHWVSDAILPSHPLLSPSSPTFKLSQHQGVFKWVSSSHQVAKVLEFQLHWVFRTDFLYDWLVGPPCYPRDSQGSSPIPRFKSINSVVLSFLYSPTLLYRRNEQWPHKRPTQTCSWMSRRLLHSGGSMRVGGRVGGTECGSVHGTFWRRSPLSSLLPP